MHKAEGGDGGVRWTGRGTHTRRGERAAHGNRGRHLSGTINSKHATRAYTVLQCSMYKWHRVLTKAALARSFRRPPTHINLNQVCSHVIAEGITTILRLDRSGGTVSGSEEVPGVTPEFGCRCASDAGYMFMCYAQHFACQKFARSPIIIEVFRRRNFTGETPLPHTHLIGMVANAG